MKTSLFRGALAVTLSAGLLMGWVPAIACAEEDEAAVADVAGEELGEEGYEIIEPSLREDLAAAEGKEDAEGLTDEEIDALVDEFVPGEGEDEGSLEEMASGFRDVTTKTAHRSEILKLKNWGITAGFNDGTFRPNATCKRGDMAAFLCRAAKKIGCSVTLPTKLPAKSFVDVTRRTAHWQEIIWCANAGIVEGWSVNANNSRRFAPNENVKRGEMAAFLYRFAQTVLPSSRKYWGNPSYFADVTLKTTFVREIRWMQATGASNGWTVRGKHYFRHNSYVKRGDMACFLVKTMNWCR